MKDFAPEQKHEILMEYQPYSRTHSFAALASRHGVNGGGRTIQNWYKRWEGIIASLQHRTGAGRPRILTPEEVEHNVEQPICEANHRAQQVRYSQTAEHVREDTGIVFFITVRAPSWHGISPRLHLVGMKQISLQPLIVVS